MKKMMKKVHLYIPVVLILIITVMSGALTSGCSKSTGEGSMDKSSPTRISPEKIALTVSAAASLKDVMGEIQKAYAKVTPDISMTFNFGASGMLEKQISQGAQVDVFISSANKQMDNLEKQGLLVAGTRRDLLRNRLVLIVHKDDQTGLSGFEGLTDAKIQKLAIGEPGSVPAGEYAQWFLSKEGTFDKLKSKMVYAKDVREVLTWVETGNATAGIVYATDAKVSANVKIVTAAPYDSKKPIVYPAAVIRSTKSEAAAKAFIDYLSGKEAKAVFEKYGFEFAAVQD